MSRVTIGGATPEGATPEGVAPRGMTRQGNGPIRRPESFDDVSLEYDTFRLPYPDAVAELVASAGHLSHGSRVLEIACGTGQLSIDLARRGCELVAVELGPNLARVAQNNLAPFRNTRVEVCRFEEWPLPEARFDAVVCANAFHWLDPDVRCAKSAEALRPGGVLVIVHVHHVRGGTPGFFEDTQPYYMKWGLSDDLSFQPPVATSLSPSYPELDARTDYGLVERHRLEVPRTQSTASYVGLLKTDSLILTLDPAARRGFLDDIAALIESKYHGEVSRSFVYEVIAAHRI